MKLCGIPAVREHDTCCMYYQIGGKELLQRLTRRQKGKKNKNGKRERKEKPHPLSYPVMRVKSRHSGWWRNTKHFSKRKKSLGKRDSATFFVSAECLPQSKNGLFRSFIDISPQAHSFWFATSFCIGLYIYNINVYICACIHWTDQTMIGGRLFSEEPLSRYVFRYGHTAYIDIIKTFFFLFSFSSSSSSKRRHSSVWW